MKTYWLEKRPLRSNVTKNIIIQEPPIWMNRVSEKRALISTSTGSNAGCVSPNKLADSHSHGDMSAKSPGSRISSPTPFGSTGIISDERRIYSPITFQDVARRSEANTPTKSSNTLGNCCCYSLDCIKKNDYSIFYEWLSESV